MKLKFSSSLLSSILGNILEWYDFGLFTIFSTLFSRLFFPSEDANTALIATLGIFAIGFFCRPIGALIFGYLGDRYGRAQTLRLSVLMISIPTLLIGILPTYKEVGLFAPILLMLTRIWQGISIGGEYSGNLIYLAESAPQRYRATYTALASMGANLGILIAAIIGVITSFFLSESTLEQWGWRIPFLISGFLCILIYKFRLQLQETNVFTELKKRNEVTRNPIKYIFTHNLSALARTLGLVCMGSTFYFFCFIYLPIFLSEQTTFSVRHISMLMTGLIFVMIILVPISGLICDHIGRRKMLLFNSCFIMCIIIPGYYFLHFSHLFLTIFILLTFTLASSLEQGTTSVALVENFPPPARYTGMSLGYNLGNGFLGGTVPMISAWLISFTHLAISPAIYICFCALVTFLVIYFFIPETKHKNLNSLIT